MKFYRGLLWLRHVSLALDSFLRFCSVVIYIQTHGTAQRLLGYAFLHYGPVHFILACLLYPLAAGKIERDVGTFQFLYINLLLSVLVAILYIVLTWILELMTFFYMDASTQCVAGLDSLFLVFLTVEALAVDDPLVQQPFPTYALFIISFAEMKPRQKSCILLPFSW